MASMSSKHAPSSSCGRASTERSLLTALLVLLTVGAFGQRGNQEVGLQIGVANYLGDLAVERAQFLEFQPQAFRPAVTILYRNNFNRFASLRVHAGLCRIVGDDAWSDRAWQRDRNLSFRSNIFDVSVMLEWNWLPYGIGDVRSNRWTPYLGAGLGVYYFNPKAELNGEWVELQPLGTEGQGLIEYPNRTKYSRLAFTVPLAFGVKFNVSRKLAIGVETRFMYNFHDYLDDVSTVYPDLSLYEENYIQAIADEARALSYRQGDEPGNVGGRKRGNSDKDDQFFMYMINLSYSIGTGHVQCPTFRR